MKHYTIRTNGKMIDLCSGPDVDRWLPGTTKVDNNMDWNGLTPQERRECVIENIQNELPFDDKSVDQITCRYAIRYLWRTTEDLIVQLKEAIRILKPQGRFIVQDVNILMDEEWQDVKWPYEYIHSKLMDAMLVLEKQNVPIYLETEAVSYDGQEYVWVFLRNLEYTGGQES